MKSKFITFGNKKVPHLIFSMTSAVDCPSKKLGLCQLQDTSKCYALKFEKMRKNVLACHERHADLWNRLNTVQLTILIQDVIIQVNKSRSKLANRLKTNGKVKYIRFNESGDFRNQSDIEKLSEIARNIPSITFYGYTARKDLDFSTLPENVVVSGSGFMIHNSFTAVKSVNRIDIVCPADCSKCCLCKQRCGVQIKAKIH